MSAVARSWCAWLGVLVALTLCASTGCSSSSGRDAAAPDASLDGSVSHDGGDDAGAVDSGEPEEPDAGPPVTDNLLLLSASISGNANTSLSFTNAVAVRGQRCFVDTIGACLVIDCGGASDVELLDAGQLEVLVDGGAVISVAPDGGFYATTTVAGPRWAESGRLTLRGTGDVVPRFRTSLVAPPRVDPIGLVPSDGGTPLITRGDDFLVRWVSQDAGVAVLVSQLTPGPLGVIGARRVVCHFDGNAGRGTVPAASTTMFVPFASTVISVGGIAETTVGPGGYRLRVDVTNVGAYRADVR